MPMRRPGYADITATLALVIAVSSGGAYAIGKIHTHDIANHAVTTKKLHKNAVTTSRIRNHQVKGADLATGLRRELANAVPPWGTIPSGTTVTGHFLDSGQTDGGLVQRDITFPAKTPVQLANADMGFGADSYSFTVDDHACAGSAIAPTAPAGHLCLYVSSESSVTDASLVPVSSNQHVVLSLTSSAGDWLFSAAWAYTAP